MSSTIWATKEELRKGYHALKHGVREVSGGETYCGIWADCTRDNDCGECPDYKPAKSPRL